MDIIGMYVAEKMSTTEISLKTGMNLSAVRSFLKASGVLRSRTDAIRLAALSGKLGSGLRGKKRVFSDDWKENISSSRIRWSSKNAKGYSEKPNGYMEHTKGPNKGRSVHVVLMESVIGRRLFANEVVHHKDGNKSNNSVENLELMTRAQHASHHAKTNTLNRKRKNNGQFE